jgi:hypothetical protein
MAIGFWPLAIGLLGVNWVKLYLPKILTAKANGQ